MMMRSTAFFFALVMLSLCLPAVLAQALSRFTSCFALKHYYATEALKRVGPYGLSGPRGICNPGFGAGGGDDIVYGGSGGFGNGGGGDIVDGVGRDIVDGGTGGFGDGGDGGFGGHGGKGGNFGRSRGRGGPAPVPSRTGEDFSEANVQVEGVDEPDIIKTDGSRVFVVRGKSLHVVEIRSNGAAGDESGKLTLPTIAREMLIQDDRLIVISGTLESCRGKGQSYNGYSYGCHVTVVYHISISGAKPKLLATLTMDSRYVSAREVAGVARIVMTSDPSKRLKFAQCNEFTRKQAIDFNTDVIRRTTEKDWLPRYQLKSESCIGKGSSSGDGTGKKECTRVASGFISLCDSVYRPTSSFSGFGLLNVATIPLLGLIKPQNSVSIASDDDTVYSTASTLYVSTTEKQSDISSNSVLSGPKFETSLHKFALDRMGAKYVASGKVFGSVLNQFSMHEHKGRFYVATTEGSPRWSRRNRSPSKVAVFAAQKKKLVQIGELGKRSIGERINSLRYIAGNAYVVTFRKVKQLYVIDLSNPKKLRVTGELKIPGFSIYLHPIRPGRILGVGQEAKPSVRAKVAKVMLFDVSDVAKPKVLSTWTSEFTSSYTNVEWDHRAFLYWKPESVAVLPLSVYGTGRRFIGSIVLHVSDKEITERGRVSHAKCCGPTSSPTIKRNLILGKKHLWSLSNEQLQINKIKDLSLESNITLDVDLRNG